MWRYYVRKYRTLIIGVCIAIFMLVLIIVGVKSQKDIKENIDSNTFSGKAMGTAVKKTIYSESTAQNEAANNKIDECLKNLENRISVRVVDSETAKCNRNYVADGTYQLPEDVLSYLSQELLIWKETKGAFSPCIYPLTTLWGIEDGTGVVPDVVSIEKVKEQIDASDMELTEDGVIFHRDDMAIDFGAVGKGIACDKVMEELAKTDVDGAVVSVGGSIAVYGTKEDNKEWHIGIRDPRGEEDDVMGVVDCAGNTVVSTSGDYEKYFEQDGKRYHHIMDSSTGYPADNGLISVTIISDSGFMSDALSTACFVMGLDDGMKYAKKKGVEAVFITEDKEVYITSGIKKSFNVKNDSYKISD